MSKDKETQSQGHLSTTIIAVITVIVTIISIIPSFLSLNNKESKIYYSLSESNLVIPNIEDESQLRNLLKQKRIPWKTLSISLVNQGNAQSNEIKLQVRGSVPIISVWSEPKKDKNIIWLGDLTIDTNDMTTTIEIKELAATKLIKLNVGFESEFEETPYIDIIHGGAPVKKVDNAMDIPKWSKFTVFKLPIMILGIGIVAMLVWAFGLVLIKRPELRAGIVNTFLATISATAFELKAPAFEMRFIKKSRHVTEPDNGKGPVSG